MTERNMAFTDPLDLFAAAIEAYHAGDYLGVAQLADPVSLRAFQRQILEQFASAVARIELTAEYFMQSSPDMPRAVAEYSAAQYQKRSDPLQRMQQELPGMVSLDALKSSTAAQVFAAWLDGQSVRRQLERARDAGHVTPDAPAWAEELQFRAGRQVALGVVQDGASIAYVVYRSHVDESASESDHFAEHLATLPHDEQQFARETQRGELPRIVRCRRQADGTWLLLAEHDFLSYGSVVMFSTSFTEDADSAPAPDDVS